jgi:hypothetical protein
MSEQGERLAAIVAGLIPEGAVLVLHTAGGWRRHDGRGPTHSPWTALLHAADFVVPEPERIHDNAMTRLAAERIGQPPPGTVIELMVMRIAELEDERSILREVVGLHPDSPVSLAMQIAGLAVDVKRLQGMLAQSQAENATLRAILASVPAPEDEP